MQLLLVIIGGLVGVIGVMISQATRDRARERARLRGAAVTLGIELGAIAESIRGGIDWNRSGPSGLYEGRTIPRGVYDGIVNSGVLSRFDPESQEILYRFYWRASIGDYRGMVSLIGQAAVAVERVKYENAPGLRAGLMRALRLAPKGAGGKGAQGEAAGTGMRGRGGGGESESVGAPIRGLGL